MDIKSYFDTVTDVTESWDKVKRIPDYDNVMGTMLFKRIFETHPSVLAVYSFKENGGLDCEKDPNFHTHAKNWVRMLDLAIHMLGPDMELVEETLLDLGARHVKYGVLPKHYPAMGQALMHVLEVLLKDSFTEPTKDAWSTIFTFFSTTMIQGSYEALMRQSES